jgi:riboflavin kinase/FMN adenylyltransferase
MNVYHDLSSLPAFRNAVITIGSFDGVHSGHQTILAQLKELAQQVAGESIVITFHPHPRQVLQPDDHSLRLLNTIDEKITLLKRYGVDHVVVVPFSKHFANQSADAYITHFLVERFSPKYIVIGYDHQFGKGREGNIDYLKKHQTAFGFKVVEIEKQEVDKLAVSSTKVRQALECGQVAKAQQLLGHPYTLSGIVVEGQRIGRSIGFPTANLDIQNPYKLIPAEGIYAVLARHQQDTYEAMLYIGKRPTLEHYDNKTIEVNILDFDKDIYGEQLSLTFVERIRDDKQFQSLEELRLQIEKDRLQTIALFQSLRERWLLEDVGEKSAEKVPRAGIVILNYNGRKWLERFLPSVLATSYPETTVYVADNGSTDDSLAFLSEKYPDVKTIVMASNYGFAEGYNMALQQIEGEDYFILLNSDVEVRPDWMEPIINIMEADKTVGACQPKILNEQKRDYFEHAGAAGGFMDYLGYPFCRGRVLNVTEKDNGQYDSPMEIFWASGAALFIRAELFKNIGGFDSRFFAHMEEIDLCWRIKRAGYKVMAVPASVVYHVGGGTLDYDNPQKVFLNFRNALVMLTKNESVAKLIWLLPLRLLLDGLAGVLFLTEGKWKNIGAILRAHWAYFGSLSSIWKQRKSFGQLIEKVRIKEKENQSGHWNGSIVLGYYVWGRKKFNDLIKPK